MLLIIDEYLAVKVKRWINSMDVLLTLAGIPDHIRSDNAAEFTARMIRK